MSREMKKPGKIILVGTQENMVIRQGIITCQKCNINYHAAMGHFCKLEDDENGTESLLTQEELDQLLGPGVASIPKKARDPWYDPANLSPKEEKQRNCWPHEWKTYTGIQETFDYCSKCDKKRGI